MWSGASKTGQTLRGGTFDNCQENLNLHLNLNSRTTVEDVPISQVPANDTQGTKAFVDVHISKPRLKPPDPNAYEVAPILSARPIQEIQ